MKSDDFDTSGFYEHYALWTGDYKQPRQTDRMNNLYSCNFDVLEETTIRLDLSMIYKLLPAQIYGVGSVQYASSRTYNHYGSQHSCIMLSKLYDEDDTNNNNKVMALLYLDQIQDTINFNKQVHVTPGQYQFHFECVGGCFSNQSLDG